MQSFCCPQPAHCVAQHVQQSQIDTAPHEQGVPSSAGHLQQTASSQHILEVVLSNGQQQQADLEHTKQTIATDPIPTQPQGTEQIERQTEAEPCEPAPVDTSPA